MRILIDYQNNISILKNNFITNDLILSKQEKYYLNKKEIVENKWLYFIYKNEKYGIYIETETIYSYLYPQDLSLDINLPSGIKPLIIRADGWIENLQKYWQEGTSLHYYHYSLQWQSYGWLVNQVINGRNVKLSFYALQEHFAPTLKRPSWPKYEALSIMYDYPKRSLLLQMGPSITMALATLVNAVVQAMRLADNGKSTKEIVFIFIMPLMMFISILLWQPLERIITKKEERRNRLRKEDNWQNQQKQKWTLFLTDWQKYQMKIEQFYIQNNVQIRNNKDIYLCLGYQELKVDNEWQKYASMIKEYVLISCQNEIILCHGNDDNYLQLITYFNLHYHILEIEAYLIAPIEWVYKYPNLLHMPLFYHHGKRNIMTDISSLKIVKSNKKILFFSFNEYSKYPDGTIFIFKDDNLHYPYAKALYWQDKQVVVMDKEHKILINCVDNEYKTFDPSIYQIHHNNVNKNNHNLEVIIGYNQQEEIKLDLSEQGMGPHALITGTTGSGKTEFVLYWILQLVNNYASDYLQILLFDFKGDSLKQSLQYHGKYIPHLNASISNLEEEDLDRALFGLENECRLREELFLKASKESKEPINSLAQYRLLKKDSLISLPELIVIFDEFAQFKQRFPEKTDVFISLARIGRSLGIHFILITQKAGGIINDQIFANIRLRIAMKVTDKQDCLEILNKDFCDYLKKAGDFVAHYDDCYLCGHAYYLQEIAKSDIVRLNYQLDKIYLPPEQKTKRQVLLAKITNQPCIKQRKIWLNVPDKSLLKEDVIGIIDDIEHRCHIFLKAEDIEQEILFIYDQEEKKEQFLKRYSFSKINFQYLTEKITSTQVEKYFVIYNANIQFEKITFYFHKMTKFKQLKKGEGLCLYHGQIMKIILV